MVFVNELVMRGVKYYGKPIASAYLLPELIDKQSIKEMHDLALRFLIDPMMYQTDSHHYEIAKRLRRQVVAAGAVPIRDADWLRWAHAEKHCFVFGSNLAGRHSGGAALHAMQRYGAILGVGEGPQGFSYAIPTKSASSLTALPRGEIHRSVTCFMGHAREHIDTTFYITRVGCDSTGLDDEAMRPLFRSMPNFVFEERWVTHDISR